MAVGDLPTHEGQRVDLATVPDHLEMNMGTGRPSGRAHERDRVAALDRLAHRNQRPLVVRVARHVAIAVVDLDEVAEPVRLPAQVTTPAATAMTLAPAVPAKSTPL